MLFRTVAGALVVAAVFLIDASESSIIHKAKLVRVIREEKTRLADGTRFDKYNEKGVELPPLPIGEEETVLNDPRIGHMDRDGGVAIPVDENGKVLKEYEYLLEPIVVDIDDNDSKKLSDSHHQTPSGSDQSKNVTFVDNTGESAKISAKPEHYDDLPEGFEYDDVASEPREPLPDVPDLPKPDYTDSGETDENVKAVEEQEESERRDPVKEVIVPSSVIQPAIVPDNVEENVGAEESDKSVDVPKNRVEEEEEAVAEEEEAAAETAEKDESSSSEELTDEGIQAMAEDLGKRVLDGVMSKASEFADTETDFEGVDENSIVAGPPSEPEVPSDKIIDMEDDSDGVELPDQELSDDELARIAAESLKPVKPDVPESPVVRAGRIGSGVQPDSASHYNISLQLLLISLFSFFF